MMENSGAIPKSKGARPKTKAVSNDILKKKCEELSLKSNSLKMNNSFSNDKKTVSNKKNYERNGSENNYKALSSNIYELPSSLTFQEINSTSEPLEKKNVLISDEGVQYKRAALSRDWVEKRLFLHYTHPPVPTSEGEYVAGAMDAWNEQMEFFIEDLSWLLQLPHHKFWSAMVFEKSVQECLQFYLIDGPRWYDKIPLDESSLSVISEVHQLTFLIYVRMATHKESKEDFITPSTFGELIYDNYLYDICKMLDLCVLYGSTNHPLLEKMINNIFTHQPKYFGDLAELVLSLNNVLKNLEEKLGILDFMVPSSLNSKIVLSVEELGDIICYLLDTCCSLQAFLSVFPKACDTFHEKEFELRLSSFYEKAVPKLIEQVIPLEKSVSEELFSKIESIRLSCLSIFRAILSWVCFRENKGSLECSLSRSIESFTHILTTCVEEKLFVTDYNATFDLRKDLLYYEEKGADMTTLDFIREAVDSIVKEMEAEYSKVGMDSLDKEEIPSTNYEVVPDPDKVGDTSGMNGYYAGETSSLSNVEIESLVSVVRDLFPDLGTGFVKECLKYYSYSSEEVLNAILEQTLPPHIEALDRSLDEVLPPAPKEEETTPEKPEDESDLLANRLNIYDDDEFDVFKKPAKVDRGKIHKGKRKGVQYEKDPELNEKVKNIIHQYEANQGYSIYEDEDKYSPLIATEYEDEYDDTYDDDDTGDVDNFGYDKRRRFEGVSSVRGRGALNAPLIYSEEDEEDDDDDDSKRSSSNSEVASRLSGEAGGGRGKSEATENSDKKPIGKLKKANASYKRGYGAREESSWTSGDSMVFTNANRGPPHSKAEQSNGSANRDYGNRTNYLKSFAENPRETRRRMERKAQSNQFRSKGCVNPVPPPPSAEENNEGGPDNRPRASTKANKHSGKQWRQGMQTEEGDSRRSHGGKYKEDTNHGKAQDRTYRQKMMHKNEQKRHAAQAKYRNNF